MRNALLNTKKCMRLALRAIIAILLVLSSIPLFAVAPSGKAYADDTVHYEHGEVIRYGTGLLYTHNMRIDGVPAYCVQPLKENPNDGDYKKEALAPTASSMDEYRSLLWFSYGGPGFDPSMWPATFWDGAVMSNDNYYAVTHILLSAYYSEDSFMMAISEMKSEARKWLFENIMSLTNVGGYKRTDADTFATECFARASEVPASFECFAINVGGRGQTIVGFSALGWAKMQKVSSDSSITNRNSSYSLSGISYGVFSDPNCSNRIATLNLDASGNSNEIELTPSTYYIREDESTVVGKGFAYDPEAHPITVVSGKHNSITLSDKPQYAKAEIWINKLDEETSSNAALGAAQLAGAEFTIKQMNGIYENIQTAETAGKVLKTWIVATDDQGAALIDHAHLVEGDALYENELGEIILPLGSYIIEETKAPVGYRLPSESKHLVQITSYGTSQILEAFSPPEQPDHVIRGDLQFVKVGSGDMARLSHIPFSLTSKTTGESHIIVTDENGYYSSAAIWTRHTEKTNGNDSALPDDYSPECGTWFGLASTGEITPPDDTEGALPYDTYILEELPCESNSNYELIKLDQVSIKKDMTTIDLGTIVDPEKATKYVSTVAQDPTDLDKIIKRSRNSQVTDTIEYMNLQPGKTYKLKSQLMYAHSGDPVLNDGAAIEAESEFEAAGSNGKFSITLSFDSMNLESNELVLYEQVFDGLMLLADDADPENTEQMVRVTTPSISTYAVDSGDEDKIISNIGTATIKDTVSYSGLASDIEYTLHASLMKITQANDENVGFEPACNSDGSHIEATSIFTPTSADGQTSIELSFDASAFESGVKLVVFEELTLDGQLVAAHKDATDEGQTVTLASPAITTSACDENTSKQAAAADPNMHIKDLVRYQGLNPGEDYQLIGLLMDRDTARPLDTTGHTDTQTIMDDLFDSLNVKRSGDLPDLESDDVKNPSPEAGNNENNPSPEAKNDSDDDEVILDPKEAPKVSYSFTQNTPIDSEALDAILTSRDSEPVVITKHNFKAESCDGEQSLGFAFPGDAFLDMKNALNTVVFEFLIHDNKLIAMHADLADIGQTVSILPGYIGTEATDGYDGDHVILPEEDAKVIDSVLYDNLIPGKQYELQGVLMDKTTNDALQIDGKPVQASKTFVANSPAGHVELEFSFDSSALQGHDLVAFEYLLKDDVTIAQHADINSSSQTVTVASQESAFLAKTGIPGNLIAALGGFTIAATAIGATSIFFLRGSSDVRRSRKLHRQWMDAIMSNYTHRF